LGNEKKTKTRRTEKGRGETSTTAKTKENIGEQRKAPGKPQAKTGTSQKENRMKLN